MLSDLPPIPYASVFLERASGDSDAAHLRPAKGPWPVGHVSYLETGLQGAGVLGRAPEVKVLHLVSSTVGLEMEPLKERGQRTGPQH